ncbi:predicted protein [Naegleria gruberi]|uniref:Predicted protein n=1 Tax=Naegleria gruberi TaxID=5762 RepID=D2VPR6_NAEGR|nr:uncharacterized protein NAEGRDRAFT_51289 [Naegleria gruberi]EFC41250.1 predicted protein [Naegleria gruberi]|eukprot:XP_002673994.1 predicted protein [Naegleria gruberi strain NEG-M]
MFESLSSESDSQSIKHFNEARKKRKQNDFAIFASFSEEDAETSKHVEEMIAAKTSKVVDPIREFEIRKVHLVGGSRKALAVLDFYIQQMQSQKKDIISTSSSEVGQLSLKEKIQIKTLMSSVSKDFKILTHLLGNIEKLQNTKEPFSHYQSDFNIIEEMVRKVAKIGEEFTETQRNVQSRGIIDKPIMKTPEQALDPVSEILDIRLGLKYILENREVKENQGVLTSATTSATNLKSLNDSDIATPKKKKNSNQYEHYLSEQIGLLKCEYELALANFVKDN